MTPVPITKTVDGVHENVLSKSRDRSCAIASGDIGKGSLTYCFIKIANFSSYGFNSAKSPG
jgi:hypothetical protein